MPWMFRCNGATAILAVATFLGGVTASPGASPGQTGKAAWIRQCVEARAQEGSTGKMRRAYCGCMQDMTDETEPLGVTELERKWPPAHRLCDRKAGMRPPRI